MKRSDLDILLQEGEGTMLDYKERLSGSFVHTMVAFANTHGGKILLGVRDNSSIIGIQDSNVLRARIQDIARNCDPSVTVSVEPVGKVIVVHVRESGGKPVQCSDGFFRRQGATTQKLSREEIGDFFRSTGAIRFDTSTTSRFRYPQDFDLEKFESWRRLSGISETATVEDVLVNLKVAERSDGELMFRNGGVLFFARKPKQFFPQAYITCILFRGTERVDILDRKDFDGGIMADIEDSLRFIERNTRVAYRIEKLRRENIPEYPMKAVREAITNAVMHRDWFFDGANIFVEIYPDRLEIVSPGGLPPGLVPEKLGQESVRRNLLIADLLQRIEFIEGAGTGIGRMRQYARIHGSPEPEFRFDTFFTVLFRPLSADAQAAVSGMEIKKAHEAHEAHEGALTHLEQVLLRACEANERTGHELQEAVGYSTRAGNFKRSVDRLLKLEMLERSLPDRPRSRKQRYRITSRGREVLKTTKKKL